MGQLPCSSHHCGLLLSYSEPEPVLPPLSGFRQVFYFGGEESKQFSLAHQSFPTRSFSGVVWSPRVSATLLLWPDSWLEATQGPEGRACVLGKTAHHGREGLVAGGCLLRSEQIKM